VGEGDTKMIEFSLITKMIDFFLTNWYIVVVITAVIVTLHFFVSTVKSDRKFEENE
jgi:hypothetical protein